MENEILAQILIELKSLNGKQDRVDQRLDSMDRRFDSMDQRFDSMDRRFDSMEQRLGSMERQQSNMEEDLMAFQEFTLQKFEVMEQRFDGLDFNQKKTNLIIENEIRPSIQVLAEGQAAMQTQLNRIEEKVTMHDEFIFRRVK